MGVATTLEAMERSKCAMKNKELIREQLTKEGDRQGVG